MVDKSVEGRRREKKESKQASKRENAHPGRGPFQVDKAKLGPGVFDETKISGTLKCVVILISILISHSLSILISGTSGG